MLFFSYYLLLNWMNKLLFSFSLIPWNVQQNKHKFVFLKKNYKDSAFYLIYFTLNFSSVNLFAKNSTFFRNFKKKHDESDSKRKYFLTFKASSTLLFILLQYKRNWIEESNKPQDEEEERRLGGKMFPQILLHLSWWKFENYFFP